MITAFTNQVSGEPGAAHAVQTSATNIQSRRITAGRVPAARISTDEPIAAGRLDEDRDEQRDTDSLARRDADSKHELLGDAVEERTEGELGAAVIIGRRLVAAPAWSSQHPVEREVGGRAQAEAEGNTPGSPRRAPSCARSKLTALIRAPAPKASTSPTRRSCQGLAVPSSAPMTSDEAASAPHPSAAVTTRTLCAGGAQIWRVPSLAHSPLSISRAGSQRGFHRSFRPGILARYTATRPIAGVVSGHDRLRWRSSKGGTTK